ncbi:Hypothetical protein A7982_05518 [Minicystis rosea]|nr:Hypothetical protein A7982_05518 [Minicystis rosea]
MCPLVGRPPSFAELPVHAAGPLIPPTQPRVLINGEPAARVGDPAVCAGGEVPNDTVRGGLMTVWIGGKPAARFGDMTDLGYILGASPNVKLGEWTPGPLTEEQAQWLYQYMASLREIPFTYPNDGCYVRADWMAYHMAQLGIPVKKQWVATKDRSPSFFLPIEGHADSGVFWTFHVAPVVEVKTRSGTTEWKIIDPSVQGPSFESGGPLTVEEWKAKFIRYPPEWNVDDADPGWIESESGDRTLSRDGYFYMRLANGSRWIGAPENLGFLIEEAGQITMYVTDPLTKELHDHPFMIPDNLWEAQSDVEAKRLLYNDDVGFYFGDWEYDEKGSLTGKSNINFWRQEDDVTGADGAPIEDATAVSPFHL